MVVGLVLANFQRGDLSFIDVTAYLGIFPEPAGAIKCFPAAGPGCRPIASPKEPLPSGPESERQGPEDGGSADDPDRPGHS